jgi:hypothetical protein
MADKAVRYTRTQWIEHIKNWRASGVSAREFAAMHNLSVSSLYARASELKPESTDLALVRVRRVNPSIASAEPTITEPSTKAGMKMRWPNGITLDFGPDVDPILLSRVLQNVGGSSC